MSSCSHAKQIIRLSSLSRHSFHRFPAELIVCLFFHCLRPPWIPAAWQRRTWGRRGGWTQSFTYFSRSTHPPGFQLILLHLIATVCLITVRLDKLRRWSVQTWFVEYYLLFYSVYFVTLWKILHFPRGVLV